MKFNTLRVSIVLAAASLGFIASARDCGESRLLQYNIADGMWYDQYNNYNRFVDWMRNQDVDVAAFCEAATHWDENKKGLPRDDKRRYFPDSLSVVSSRWGHPYMITGAFQDNYPVAITSRYEPELVRPIGGDKLSHGALHAKIRGVNYVVIHLWPQRYSLQDKDKTRSDNLGDSTRINEIRHILSETIYNPDFADEKYWVMMGDFNTTSPADDAYYEKTPNYQVHNTMRATYPCDVIEKFHKGEFVPSENRNKRRIDFTYCNDAMENRLISAETLDDEFTKVASDHKPTIIVFKDCGTGCCAR